jgi:rubrerythrin
MPQFMSPFVTQDADRNLTFGEAVRAIRFMIAAEYESIQMCTQIVESVNYPLIKTVFTGLANEKRVHAGQLLRLLREVAPDEQRFYAEGERRVEASIKALGTMP